VDNKNTKCPTNPYRGWSGGGGGGGSGGGGGGGNMNRNSGGGGGGGGGGGDSGSINGCRNGEAYVSIGFVATFDSVSHKLLHQALAVAGASDKSWGVFRAS
jgi:hypothetical protein